jgi:hypothetical protein
MKNSALTRTFQRQRRNLRVSESINNIPYDDMSNFGLLNLLRHARERPSWCKLRGAASGLPSSEAKLREAFVNRLFTQHD